MAYWDYRDELSTYNGSIYRGERTVIPKELRATTLKIIHNSHLGVVKCKQRARELVFWPGMNGEIEDIVSKCSACLTQRNKPQKEPMIIQPLPTLPWSKVGTDLFELGGNNYMVMVDYYSNFIEVSPLHRDTKTSTVIKVLKENIARYGIMDVLISDNGPQFSSEEFKVFVSEYGIQHITSSPLHQQSNGLAEKAVQTVKNTIAKCFENGDDIYLSLLELRNTPRDNMGSPMQRLMGRRGKTLLPITDNLRRPEIQNSESIASKLLNHRQTQKFYYDQNSKVKEELDPNKAVRIYTPNGWQPAEFVRGTNYPRSYIVKAGQGGREYRRNTDMLMNTNETPHMISEQSVSLPYNIDMRKPERQETTVTMDTPVHSPSETSKMSTQNTIMENNTKEQVNIPSQTIRRSSRVSKRPKHLSDYVVI